MIGTFTFKAPLWLWKGDAAWHFLSVPIETSHDIADLTAGLRRGFGSVRVEVTIGASTWRTSVFPDSSSGCFILPIKKAIRLSENLKVDSVAHVKLTLIDL